jgi:hypothetical protein
MSRIIRIDALLKQLMLGLIYPAVLGTVLYSALGAAVDPLLMLVGLSREAPTVNASGLKWTLVVVTLVFYLCDYLYIMFTKTFRSWFFVADLVFLMALYATFRTLDIESEVLALHHLIAVAVCYVLFMFLYLSWDVYEWRRTIYSRERHLYKKVIAWESMSLLLLVLWLFIACFFRSVDAMGWALAVILAAITVRFSCLVREKRLFLQVPGPNLSRVLQAKKDRMDSDRLER